MSREFIDDAVYRRVQIYSTLLGMNVRPGDRELRSHVKAGLRLFGVVHLQDDVSLQNRRAKLIQTFELGYQVIGDRLRDVEMTRVQVNFHHPSVSAASSTGNGVAITESRYLQASCCHP